MAGVQVSNGGKVDRGVFADGGVRASAGLHANDAVFRQGLEAGQHHGVLAGVNVVGYDADGIALAHGFAQPAGERGLAGAHRSADADT